MLLTIEPDGPVPIYLQIRDRIIEAIAAAGGHRCPAAVYPAARG